MKSCGVTRAINKGMFSTFSSNSASVKTKTKKYTISKTRATRWIEYINELTESEALLDDVGIGLGSWLN